MGAERYVLLVNPSAGGGRSQKRLPEVRAALEAAGADYELVTTRDLDHGAMVATQAAAGRLDPGRDERRRADRQDRRPARRRADAARRDPRRPRQRLRPGARHPDRAREGGRRCCSGGAPATIDVGEVNGERFLCIASCGFDSDANRIANEARLLKGPLVYAYAAIRALVQWKTATFTLTLDGRRAHA